MDQKQKADLLQDETLSQKLIKKGFWLYLFSYLIAPGGYLIRLLISNSAEVSVADVGILYSIIGLVNFLNVYNDLGLTESLQYFLPKFWIQKKFNAIKTTIWISLCVQLFSSLLIIIGLWFGSEWLAQHYFQQENAAQILKYFCWYFIGINLFQTLQSIFMAFQKTFDYQFVEFVKIWATVGFTFFCFLTGNGSIEWYSLNWILGLAIGIITAGLLYRNKYHSLLMQGKFERDKPMLKEYRKYALWAFIGANVGNIFGQIIQQMVIYFLGAEAAGYYANFLSLFLIGNLIFAPIMTLVFPLVSELSEKKNYNKIAVLCSFFYSYFSLLVFLFSVLMMAYSREITVLFFGNKFLMSGELLMFFSLFQGFGIFTGFNFSLLGGLGKNSLKVICRGISVLIVLLFGIFGLSKFGLKYSGLIYVLGNFILWSSSLYFILREIKFTLDLRFLLKNISLLSVVIALLLFGKYYFSITNIFGLIVSGLIVCFMLYLINKDKIGLIYSEIKKLK